jgi:hypothetical protein
MKSLSFIKALLLCALTVVFMSASDRKGEGLFEGSGDVGSPKLKGYFVHDRENGIYTLSGGGINLWYTSDQFFYLWKKANGNFSLTAKVEFEGKGVDPHRKIGVMIRETLTGESKYADIAIHGDGLTSLQYRPVAGEQTLEVVGPKGGNYITIERIDNKIRMKTATDAFPQEVTGEIELPFSKNCYVGLFIGSHNTDVLETARFSLVEFKKL